MHQTLPVFKDEYKKQPLNKPFCEPVPGKMSYFCHTL
ncbi:hypothetical protein ECYG_01417 [Escherichia coli B367]|nr:hypothetical protein ECYG_01417 [Escherichia coli B367]